MGKIIGIVGMTGSGKSIISEYLESIGFKKVYFGGITYEKMEEEGIAYTPENDKKMRVRLREEYGMAAYAILSLSKIREYYKNSNVVIDGLYSWEEYKVLKEEFKDDLVLVATIVDKDIRYERLRIREDRPYTKEEAIDRDLNEIEKLSKGGPIVYADYYVFNDTTKEESINEFKVILNKIIEKDI